MIYGWLWGFYQATTSHFLLQPYILNHVNWLYQYALESSNRIERVETIIDAEAANRIAEVKKVETPKFARLYLAGALSIVVMMGTFLIAYFAVESTVTIPSNWDKIIEDKCPDLHKNKRFSARAFVDMGLCFLLPSAYFGLLLDV